MKGLTAAAIPTYPYGLVAEKIHAYAKIVAIADIYAEALIALIPKSA